MIISECLFEQAFVTKLKSLREDDKRLLLHIFWPESNFEPRSLDHASHSEYLDFMVAELEHVKHHRDLFAAQDLAGTSAIIQEIRNNPHKPYDEVVQYLSTQLLNFDTLAIRRSIELSTRLWLLLNIRSSAVTLGPIFAGDDSLEWDGRLSLVSFLQRQFVQSRQSSLSKEYVRIGPACTAAYYASTCGMRIRWTDDMASHLNFDLETLVLTVYRHKICLVNHLDNPKGCPFPADLLGEALDTMNLLFPLGDVATKRLLLKEGQRSIYTLGSCGRSRNLDLSHYQYFGDKLHLLMESFDKSPRTWQQLAFDRRNKLEWSAFWVTVMVAILTVISIPCNIIQATYSVKGYYLAVAQGNGGVVVEGVIAGSDDRGREPLG